MRLLDLYCCAGGCTKGYQQAGFEVVGIDIVNYSRYCGDAFVQMDALVSLEVLTAGGYIESIDGRKWYLTDFNAISASPPCQGYSDLRYRTGKRYPMLIEDTRRLLLASDKPYVIENVEGAPLINPILLCGSMFDGLRVLRHRLFESNVLLPQPDHDCRHIRVFTHDKRKTHYGLIDQDEGFVQVTGGGNCSVKNAAEAMGINWMTKRELNEAIPPAYTEWIGRYLIEHVVVATKEKA